MTDYSLIKNKLIDIFHYSEAELETYSSFIEGAVDYAAHILIEEEKANDARIVNLCAVKAYYQIVLTSCADDGITSFKAGDISYTRDLSSVSRAKALLETALADCSDLIKNSRFSFKAV